jgi:uncharacterized DUF497 family protein
MMFDWDAANTGHIARHQITPEEAEQIIQDEPLDLGRQIRNGERRTLHLGETNSGRVLIIVITERAELLRVVTAYPADRQDRAFYEAWRDHGKNHRHPRLQE